MSDQIVCTGLRVAFLVALLSATPALAAREAERIATRTGEVIGAAEACGVPQDELVALGRKVIGRARDTAKDAADLQRAQAAHEAAVTRAALRTARAGDRACPAAMKAFRALERERR